MSFFRLLVGVILLALLGGCVGVQQVMTPPPEFTITTASETDQIGVSFSREAPSTAEWAALFEVRSETGIGKGKVALAAGDWPSPITLRLYLGGLEELRVAAGDSTVQLSVSSGPGQQVRQSLESSGATGQQLTPTSPYWLSLTSGEGYYDVQLPSALIAPGVEAFDLNWIDFYR